MALFTSAWIGNRPFRFLRPCCFGIAAILVWIVMHLQAADLSPFTLAAPIPIPVDTANGNGQRLFWDSQPGLTYELQTAADLADKSGGGSTWTTIAQITAVGPVSWADDPSAAAQTSRYYRVLMLAPTNDVTPPQLSLIQATQPPTPPALPTSTLTVSATDNVSVKSVDFLEGNNLLGTAIHGLGNEWSFEWIAGTPSTPASGRYYLRARASDAAGNVGYSPVLAFDLASASQACATFGAVSICADTKTVNGGTASFSGNIRINGIRLSGNASVTATSTRISGVGDVIVPGLNTVLTGSFDIDPQTGWLTVQAGTTPTFPSAGIALSPQAMASPTQLSVNVLTNSLSGAGSVTLEIPNHLFGPATFAGSFNYSPGSGTVALTGGMVLSNLLACSGSTTLNLNDSSFAIRGDTRFQSSNGDVYYLSNSVAQLTVAPAPNLYVSGDLGLPEGLALHVQGNVSATGQVELTGSGHGPVGGFEFDPIELTLTRPPGLSSIATVNFQGKLANANFSNYFVAGTIRSNGDLDVTGTGDANFNGFEFSPLNLHLLRNAATTNQVIAYLDGTLRLSYIKPVAFNGVLRQDGSVELNGQSGPYTIAAFGGVAPHLDDPGLAFDQQLFLGMFQLSGRDPSVQTLFDFHFARGTDASGGASSLGLSAATTSPGRPRLTLTGTASSTGACSLTASLGSQEYNLWGFAVNSLTCGVSRDPQGTIAINITGGTLSYGPLVGTSSQASGSIGSDGSGLVTFSLNSCTLGGYALQNVSLALAQSSSGTRTMRMSAGSMILPGFASETVALTGTLTNDGTFSLTGTTSDALALSGMAVATLASGSTVSLTQNGLTITGTISGGVLSHVASASGSATGTLAIARDGSAALAGCVTLSPLTFGQFQIRSTAADGSFTACFGAGPGLGVAQNSVLITYNGAPLTTSSLPSFAIGLDGSFDISVDASMTAGLTLNSYSLPKASFTFHVAAGIANAQNFNASLTIPGFNPGFSTSSANSLNGSLNSDGTFSLTSTSSSAQTLNGLAVTSLADGSTVSLTQNGLTITGTISGGVLSHVASASGSAVGTLAIAPNGSASLSGCVTLSPLTFGQFQIRSTAADGSFTTCFGGPGLAVAQHSVQITYNGSPLTTPSLPSFAIGLDGSFDISVDASMTAGLTLDSYSLPKASFTFHVAAGIANAQNFNASLTIPGFNPGFSTSSANSLNGSLNSDGTFSLTSTSSSAQTLNGLAVTSLADGSTISLTQNGLTITGTISGGVLSHVASASGSAIGTLTVAPNGSASLSGCVTLSPLTFGQFQIRSTAADGSFTTCFGGPGLAVAQHSVQITYNGSPLTTPSLPSFSIGLDGSFDISVDASMTAGLTLNSYSLPKASFTFHVAAGIANAQNFNASLTIPGFNPGFSTSSANSLNGSLNSDGTFSLTSTSSSAQTLNGLAVTSLADGSTITMTQNGLTITGTISGGVLSHVASASGSAIGTLTIAPNGSASLSGCVTLSPLTFGQFQIRSTAADGSFTTCFGGPGLAVAQHSVQITYNGSPLTTPSLPSFSIGLDGSFDISVDASMTAGLTLNSYSLPKASFTFHVAAGVANAQNFKASLTIPGFNPGFSTSSANSLNGSLNSDGTFSLTSTSSSAQTLNGLAVTSLADGSTITMTQNGLTITGTISGGVLSHVASASGSAIGTLTIAPNGSASLSGCVTLSPLTFGQFQIRSTAADGSFTTCFGGPGLAVAQHSVQITYNGSPLTTPSLPSFSIGMDGSFDISVDASMTAGLTLNSYSLPKASFTFHVAAGAANAQNFKASLTIPGFNPGFSTSSANSLNGSLNSDGTFSLTSTSSSAQTLNGLAVTSLADGSTISLTQNGLTITGTISGGVLSHVASASGSAIGTLTIAPNGSASLSGCVALSPLTFGQFQIRSTAANGDFTACFGPGGLAVSPTSKNPLNLLFNGSPLTTLSLPSFTISLDGSLQIAVSSAMTAGITLDGFKLSNASFLFSASGGGASAGGFGATLSIPSSAAGFYKGAVAASVSGELNSDGSFSLTGSLSGSTAISLSLPFTSVAKGAAFHLTQNGLTMSGTFSGGVLKYVPGVSTAVSASIATDGSISLNGTLTTTALVANQISVEPTSGTTFTWNVNNSGISLSGPAPQVRIAGVFSVPLVLPTFSMNVTGDFSVGVFSTKGHVIALNLLGYSFTGISCTVSRTGGVLSISSFGGNLAIPGFSQHLAGTVDSAGTVTLDYAGSVGLGGFSAPADGHLALRNSGLTASGTLNLSVAGASLGSLQVVANVAPGTGTYSASGSTSITIGGYSTSTFSATVSPGGVSGAPTLTFGNLSVTLPDFSLTPSTVSGSGSAQKDSGWVIAFDVPGEVGDIYGRLEGNVSLSVSGPSSVSANLSATFGWWIVTLNHCNPGPPFGDGACFYNYGPDSIPSDHSSSVSGGINSDGQFCVNQSICNPFNKCQNQFCFTLW